MPTEEQERWGAAVALLSLDVVSPFYRYMGLELGQPDAFQKVLRDVIVSNRRLFEADQSQIPDLKRAVLETLENRLGTAAAGELRHWVEDILVYTGQEFAHLSQWHLLLGLARTSHERWAALGFPGHLSEKARQEMDKVFDFDELDELADQVDECPLSDWDLEMYALHGFDDDDNDPYNWVMEAVTRIRFEAFLKWLIASLSEQEQRQLVRNANTLRSQIESFRDLPPLQELKELV